MDVKEAIVKAKGYVADMFQDEGVVNIGLEEIRLDDEDHNWLITVGFSRVAKGHAAAGRALENVIGPNPNLPRTYKVVKLHKHDGDFISITNRSLEN
ncbi:hypothetical protein FV222_24895 [Methylobacterium sp. WL103]|uniref:hypothetical protein n=1 Tax=unclassified Methylobacterium TaxID=2615210 RepID=UPI0011C964FE|nr:MULTISPECIES: hypothetical protein [unclassified Methylobacterium]TXM67112.1 hypothetical protein FV226_22465 [Methylobacterium sp. WL12]TXM90933.1 hypothetical protein FV222_24895 [Methylobacterium sp. WL103]